MELPLNGLKYAKELPVLIVLVMTTCLFASPSAYADGGAPNLAYVAGTSQGISVIDVQQQKVTGTINVSGNPHTILLSPDGRFLYVTQPQQGQIVVIGAKAGKTLCTATVPGQPTLLAIDPRSDGTLLFAAGNGASTVSEINPTNCAIIRTFQVGSPVYGLGVAIVGSGLPGSAGNQLWVANTTALNAFDDGTGQQVTKIDIPAGPRSISIPFGATIYATTSKGSVVAVDLTSHQAVPLISGGVYGPMDYDATTGEVYVPDMQHHQIIVLAPVNAGTSRPHEPSRIIELGVSPTSVAITSDGLLAFVALSTGYVAMLDIPGRKIITTINIGGHPQFIITGLYPPPLDAPAQQTTIDPRAIIAIIVGAVVFEIVFIPIWLIRRRKSKQTPS